MGITEDGFSSTYLAGWKLALARLIWFGIAAAALATVVVGLPVRLSYLSEILLPPIFGRGPGPLGMTVDFVAAYITTGEILLGVIIWFVIGVFVFWRKSDDGLVIFFSALMLAASVFMSDYTMSLAERKPAWRTLVISMRAFTFSAILVFYYIFPNGHFVPHFTRRLAMIWVAYTVSWIFFPKVIPPSNHIVTTPREMVLGIWFFLWLASGAFAQLYRYRRVKDPVERQQTKWIVFGTSAVAIGTVGTFSPAMLFPVLRTPGPAMVAYTTIAFSLIMMCLALVPLTIAFSILRYRLWDIDVIINRALVYGTLTVVVGLFYFGSVLLFQLLVGAVSGVEQSSLASVVSTLLIASLISPLRRGIQNHIDRRFFRRKYDLAKTLEEFNATVRTGGDLDEISEAILGVVDETMQSEHVSLWLKSSE